MKKGKEMKKARLPRIIRNTNNLVEKVLELKKVSKTCADSFIKSVNGTPAWDTGLGAMSFCWPRIWPPVLKVLGIFGKGFGFEFWAVVVIYWASCFIKELKWSFS